MREWPPTNERSHTGRASWRTPLGPRVLCTVICMFTLNNGWPRISTERQWGSSCTEEDTSRQLTNQEHNELRPHIHAQAKRVRRSAAQTFTRSPHFADQPSSKDRRRALEPLEASKPIKSKSCRQSTLPDHFISRSYRQHKSSLIE